MKRRERTVKVLIAGALVLIVGVLVAFVAPRPAVKGAVATLFEEGSHMAMEVER